MKTNTCGMSIVLLLIALSFGLTGCKIEDGKPLSKRGDSVNEVLGFQSCEKSSDCGIGSYCHPDNNLCTIECTANRDCYFYDKDARKAWQEAQEAGIAFEDAELPALKYKCSDCGGCIPVDQEVDERCPSKSVYLCEEDAFCQQVLDNEWICNSDGYCTLPCENDEDCGTLDRGHICGEDPGNDRKACYKWCYDHSSCSFHGYDWRCQLPEGIGQTENFFSRESVIGRCTHTDDGVDWGEHLDTTKENHKIVGVYGAINNSTFTNCGFPLVNCQDTTNIHHLLFRIRQTEDGIEMDGKYCYHEAKNFRADDTNETLDVPRTEFDDLAWMEVPEKYTLAVAFHHWNANPESFNVGDVFRTDHYLEIRGALLDDPANDPLPTRDTLETAWDQDRDDLPGLTTVMNGILTGEIYNVNRADQFGDFEIAQVDEDGRVMKIKGLLTTENESIILGSSDPTYDVNIEPNLYADPNRSFMRFMRLDDDATCLDVIKMGRSEENCGSDYNQLRISVDDDTTYLCHTPTVDGPSE